MKQEEYFRYKKNWWISLNISGRNEPMKLRSDFNEALTKLHRHHQESGEEQLRPGSFWKNQRWHPSSNFIFQNDLVAMERFLAELMTIYKKIRN